MSKLLSIFLLIVAASLTLWRGSQAFMELWHYIRLDAQATAQIENWQIKEVSPSKYSLGATYSYVFQDVNWKSQSELPPPYFPNRFAAGDAKSIAPKNQIKIWLDKSSPAYSALKKEFPWRAIIYALSSLAILLYFVYITQFSAEAGKRRGGKKT